LGEKASPAECQNRRGIKGKNWEMRLPEKGNQRTPTRDLFHPKIVRGRSRGLGRKQAACVVITERGVISFHCRSNGRATTKDERGGKIASMKKSRLTKVRRLTAQTRFFWAGLGRQDLRVEGRRRAIPSGVTAGEERCADWHSKGSKVPVNRDWGETRKKGGGRIPKCG